VSAVAVFAFSGSRDEVATHRQRKHARICVFLRRRTRQVVIGALVATACLMWPPAALAQMPDPRAMSGLSMPTADLPDGTVTVRVVRDQITNNVAGVAVELHGAGAVRRETTGADGRAQFTGVPAGAEVHAIAVVDGQRLESKPFVMPARGGVRTLLAAVSAGPESAPAAGASPAPAPSTTDMSALSIGSNSRIATEFSDDVLQVFYLLEIVNRRSVPVAPPSALVFEMPTGAEGTTVLEGSTPNANARGPRVTVTGPFAPGATPLQIAFRINAFGTDTTITSKFPLSLDAVSVAVQKVGQLTVSSPQLERMQEAPINAAVFMVGMGPRLQAGAPLVLELHGVPHQSRTPVYVALALAGAIVGTAVWFLLFPGHLQAADARRRALLDRREKGLAALSALERDHRAGRIGETEYTARRATLVSQLERVYGELDAGGAPPGGHGVAA
jgi:hypothetical protein